MAELEEAPAPAGRAILPASTNQAVRAQLESLLDVFVHAHRWGPRQRSAEWLEAKKRVIGGSELAAALGKNPYSSPGKLVRNKAGLDSFTGGTACHWGTLLESAIERFVECDCGARLVGTEISVPAPANSPLRGLHANSPDGYGVFDIFFDGEAWGLVTSDAETQKAAASAPQMSVAALLEFKCPYRRMPKPGEVPGHYRSQVLSGLALSTVADIGLFVDAVFRKCAFWNLGETEGYDTEYHRERRNPAWKTPIAWGFTGIYAPTFERSSGASDGAEADLTNIGTGGFGETPAYAAWRLYMQELGVAPPRHWEAAAAEAAELVDLGDCDSRTFDEVLRHVDKKNFRTEHVGPCLASGAGTPLGPDEISAEVDRLRENAPEGHYLWGVLPWKLFEVNYVFVERDPDFLGAIEEPVRRVLDAAEAVRSAESPEAEYLRLFPPKKRAPPRRSAAEIAEEKSTIAEFHALLCP